jgi:hypothetical protein
MTEINPETGQVEGGRSSRFTLWIAFLVFATITLGSSVEVVSLSTSCCRIAWRTSHSYKHTQKNNLDQPNSASKWAVACSAVTFALSLIVCAAHISPVMSTMCVGTKLEGILITVMVACWAATVAIITNASNNLGIISDNGGDLSISSLNANLYFFSWAGFVTS